MERKMSNFYGVMVFCWSSIEAPPVRWAGFWLQPIIFLLACHNAHCMFDVLVWEKTIFINSCLTLSITVCFVSFEMGWREFILEGSVVYETRINLLVHYSLANQGIVLYHNFIYFFFLLCRTPLKHSLITPFDRKSYKEFFFNFKIKIKTKLIVTYDGLYFESLAMLSM